MTLVALLSGGFAGTKDAAMVSGGAVETQTFVEENLSAIRDMCHVCTFHGCTFRSKRKANHVVLKGATTRVVNSCLMTYVPVC